MRYSEDRKIGGISGRAIFAVVAVTILIGGFVFGYFVGKKIPPSYVAPSETKKQTQKPKETAQRYSTEEDAETSQSMRRKGSVSTPSEEEPVEEEQPASVPKKKKAVTSKQTVRKETKSSGTKYTEKAKPDQPTQKETEAQGAASETFTVQVGAFKNQKEAEKLALRLEDKGYRALVKKVTTNNILLHKVTVGEFVKRKDAEVFALKFRVTEGLDAFVTVRN
ncbi:MAG: SPOR domain-containing protein [Nitrospirota bacterium]